MHDDEDGRQPAAPDGADHADYWNGSCAVEELAYAVELVGGDEPVDPAIIDELLVRIPDFRRAHEPDGLTPAGTGIGTSARTLRGDVAAYHDLTAAIRDVVLPNPALRAS